MTIRTITKTVYLIAYHFGFMENSEVSYGMSAHAPDIGGVVVGVWPHRVTLPFPDDFNVHAAQIEALEAEKKQAIDAYQATVASINERLGKLLALSNEVAA